MNFVNVYEPRSNVTADSQRTHVVYSGGMRYTETILPSNSGTSIERSSFTLGVPSTQTIIDRYIRLRCYFTVTVDADLQIGLNDCIRQNPISSLISILGVRINGAHISDTVSDKLHALLTYGNDSLSRNGSVSMTPSSPDNYQEYSDWSVYGSSKNPMASYGENGAEDPRGGFEIIPDPVTPLRKFSFVAVEPLMISPFFNGQSKNLEEGMVNVNDLLIEITWIQQLYKILSHSSLGNAITQGGITVEFNNPPEVICTYITPAENQLLPALQTLPYCKTSDFIKLQTVTLAPGASSQYTSETMKLNNIPESFCFFVMRNRGTANHTTSNSFCRIDKVTLLWNNNSTLLATATPDQLFEMSKRNGCNLSYQQFRKYRGSVFRCSFGKDLGLAMDEAPGVQGQFSFQLIVDYTNVSSLPLVNPEAYLILNQTGSIQIAENMCRVSLGLLTRDIVVATKGNGSEMSHSDYMNLQGGSFFSGLKNFFNGIARFVSPVAHALTAVPGIGKYAGPIGMISDAVGNLTAPSGSGLSGGYSGRGLSGGRRMMRR